MSIADKIGNIQSCAEFFRHIGIYVCEFMISIQNQFKYPLSCIVNCDNGNSNKKYNVHNITTQQHPQSHCTCNKLKKQKAKALG